jgi:CDP-diacylglycerol--glycerol-3-phosphate 3-phosphatidyltransferase
MPNLEQSRRKLASYVTIPASRLLARTPLTPDALTWLGFLLTLGAAALVVLEHFIAAGLVYLAAALFDMLDGALARATNRTTRFGAVLDSSLDRVSEGVVLLGLVVMFARNGEPWEALLAGLTMLFSFMVSYIKARMEGLGVECKAGFFTRPERVVLLTAALLTGNNHYALVVIVAVIAALSLASAIERLLYARRHTQDQP